MIAYVSLLISIIALVTVFVQIWLRYFRKANVMCKIIRDSFTLPKNGWATLHLKILFWNPSRRIGIIEWATVFNIGLPPHDYQRGSGLNFLHEDGNREHHITVQAGEQVVVEKDIKIPWINQRCYVAYYMVDRRKKYESPEIRLYQERINHKNPFAKLIWESEE